MGQRPTETEDLCRKFSKQQANINFEKQKELKKELHELMNKPKSGDISQQIGKIQQELGIIHNKWVLGAKIRSEKSTKYFLTSKTIDSLRKEFLNSLTSGG